MYGYLKSYNRHTNEFLIDGICFFDGNYAKCYTGRIIKVDSKVIKFDVEKATLQKNGLYKCLMWNIKPMLDIE